MLHQPNWHEHAHPVACGDAHWGSSVLEPHLDGLGSIQAYESMEEIRQEIGSEASLLNQCCVIVATSLVGAIQPSEICDNEVEVVYLQSVGSCFCWDDFLEVWILPVDLDRAGMVPYPDRHPVRFGSDMQAMTIGCCDGIILDEDSGQYWTQLASITGQRRPLEIRERLYFRHQPHLALFHVVR